MDDAKRLVEALKSYGDNLPNLGERKQENEIENFLRKLQFSGGGAGGKTSGGIFGGGRLGYEYPLDSTSSITPYVQGYAGKPTNQPITGGLTGLGLEYRKKF